MKLAPGLHQEREHKSGDGFERRYAPLKNYVFRLLLNQAIGCWPLMVLRSLFHSGIAGMSKTVPTSIFLGLVEGMVSHFPRVR